MKTKNILKAMAAAMLMPAMMLTTACSSDDDLANPTPENIIKKGYEVPVTVSATRQGDADATGNRASFNGTKLEFTAGDKLFVYGENDAAGEFAGTLDYVSDGKFSGTITTQNEYTGTTYELLTAGSAEADLLPNGYKTYDYLYFDNNGTEELYDDRLTWENTMAFAESKAEAVEQFSLERGAYTSGTGFTLVPKNAVLNFTITGLAASTPVAVVFKFPDDGGTISKNVTTNGSGTAKFAISVFGGKDLIDCTLTVGGKAIILVSSSKTLAAGKIYNISRIAGVEAVDLGLTSGTKWANMNVSYVTVGDNGFFAWGDTKGYRSVDTSDYYSFSWATYKWCQGTNITLTKYNNNSAYGTVDNKVTLEAADDAATDNWGSLWRMPTAAEWQELLATKSNTTDYTWSWVAVDGLNGWRITRKSTGANIFLPAAGYRDNENTINERGNVGNYWSSSLDESGAESAHYFYFNSSEVEMRSCGRYYGQCVRAVLK